MASLALSRRRDICRHWPRAAPSTSPALAEGLKAQAGSAALEVRRAYTLPDGKLPRSPSTRILPRASLTRWRCGMWKP